MTDDAVPGRAAGTDEPAVLDDASGDREAARDLPGTRGTTGPDRSEDAGEVEHTGTPGADLPAVVERLEHAVTPGADLPADVERLEHAGATPGAHNFVGSNEPATTDDQLDVDRGDSDEPGESAAASEPAASFQSVPDFQPNRPRRRDQRVEELGFDDDFNIERDENASGKRTFWSGSEPRADPHPREPEPGAASDDPADHHPDTYDAADFAEFFSGSRLAESSADQAATPVDPQLAAALAALLGPPGAVPPGAFPSGAVSSGALSSGAVWSGAVSSGAVSSDAQPSGTDQLGIGSPAAVPSVAVPSGAVASGAVASGAVASGVAASGPGASVSLSAGEARSSTSVAVDPRNIEAPFAGAGSVRLAGARRGWWNRSRSAYDDQEQPAQSDWRWVEEWRRGGEPTPWGPGLALAGFAGLIIGTAVYVISVGLADRPLLAVLANIVVAAGLSPALWMSRHLPVLRWVSLGGAIGTAIAWISVLFFRHF